MGVNTSPQTFVDLTTELLSQVQENPNSADAITKAKRAINIALDDMRMGTDYAFVWPERHAFIQLRPNTTFNISLPFPLEQGDTSLFLTGAAVVDSFGDAAIRPGGKLLLPGSEVVFEVTGVPLIDVVPFTPAFTGVDINEGGVVYFEDEYDLVADFERPVDATRFSVGSAPIPLIGRTEFRMRYPRNRTFSRPLQATIFDRGTGEMGITTGATRRIAFHPAPSLYDQVRYSYTTSDVVEDTTGAVVGSQFVSDLDVPIMPLRYRYALILKAAADWFQKTDDARSLEFAARHRTFMDRAMGATEVGQSTPRFVLDRSHAIRQRRPWSGAGTPRQDINGVFDRIGGRRWLGR